MKKSLDYIELDEQGSFDLEGFSNTTFARIKALAVTIADCNLDISDSDRWALSQVLCEEVLEVDKHLRKLLDKSLEMIKTNKAA